MKKPVIATNRNGKEKRFDSIKDAVKEGFNASAIVQCCRGYKSRIRHQGLTWRYEQAIEKKS